MHGYEGRHEGYGCGHQARHHHGDHGCCCGHGAFGPGMFHRRFISREERIAHLERYLHELQQEAKAVEEHLSDLKAAQEEATWPSRSNWRRVR